MPSFYSNSPRWEIFNAIASALETEPSLQAVRVERNPSSALRVEMGDYVIVVTWNNDSAAGKKGNREQRRFRLLVGSIANTGAQSGRDADAMHEAVSEVVRQQWPRLSELYPMLVPIEQEVAPDVESILVEGALVLSSWDVTYERPVVFYRPQ